MPFIAARSGQTPSSQQRNNQPATDAAKPHYGATRPVVGIVLLVLSTWALSGLDSSAKWVMGAGVSLFMVCWMRYAGHLLLVLALVLPSKGQRVWHSLRMRNQILRGVLMLAATVSFFTTLSYLPQAEATAINFLAPLMMLALAPWLLGEPPKMSRWVAAGVGFAGVLVIIRPGSGLDPVGTVFGLITACLFAAQYLVTRRVAIDDPFTTLVWSGAVGTIVLTIALPFFIADAWPVLKTLSATHWLVLAGTGFWGALGHLMQIQAYRNAPASLLAPVVYLQIVSAAVLGWLIWDQFPDLLTWVGIGVVCASGITIGAVEWRNQAKTG